jgi:hypothetical protein
MLNQIAPPAELTDRQYEIADAIDDYLDTHRGQDFNASTLAQIAKCGTHEAHAVLRYLVENRYIATAGRGGAWTRYTSKRLPQHADSVQALGRPPTA